MAPRGHGEGSMRQSVWLSPKGGDCSAVAERDRRLPSWVKLPSLSELQAPHKGSGAKRPSPGLPSQDEIRGVK